MPNNHHNVDISAQKHLRRCILLALYAQFREVPYAEIELRQLEQDCQTDTRTLNWNMVYLEKSGLVELGRSIENPPYVASSASLTAVGIDVIEDDADFNKRFPEMT